MSNAIFTLAPSALLVEVPIQMPLKLSSGSAACEARSGTSGALGPWAEQEQMASTSKSTNFIADGMADRMT